LGLLDLFNGKKKQTEPVRDLSLEIAKADCLKVVGILKNSMYQESMQWDELTIRFRRITGLPIDTAKERLINAMELLKRSQGIGWGGIGCAVYFSRTTPMVV
jgi:hypothetical protein